jgi:CheY-like chemotaxis protein
MKRPGERNRAMPGIGMKRRVLIVDDDHRSVTCCGVADRTGYDVSDAPDGKQAIEILRKQNFDVVLQTS